MIDDIGTTKCNERYCIHRLESGTCSILSYVDNKGADCHFKLTKRALLRQKKTIRAIYNGPDGRKRFEKILLYNPEMYDDPFFSDIISEIEGAAVS